MIRFICVLSVLSLVLIESCHGNEYYPFLVQPGPKYPPTNGRVWPDPQVERKEQDYFVFDLSSLVFNLTESPHSCLILERAIGRYALSVNHGIARHLKRHNRRLPARTHLHADMKYKGSTPVLYILLAEPCEDYPHYNMREDYVLDLPSDVSKKWTLRSSSVWGILRGIESYTHLFYFYNNFNEIRVNATYIEDFPRYSHRGLLLDTSRHYISVKNIKLTLDAMTMNKLNVFHWHIVDDQSFPYVSETFPDLSAHGAYHPTMVYTKKDIEKIVNYARDRGIRVVPEFDVPGHTRSWGASYPLLLTSCYNSGQTEVVGLGPMNPINNATYKFLQDLFSEVQTRFPDKYFHVGGDEVEMDCWKSNPELQEYIKTHNLTSVADLHALFMERTLPLLAKNTTAIVWQEVFDEGVPLDKNVLVHIWKYNWIQTLFRVLKAGYKVIFSAAWYLDHLATGGDWENFYNADPAEQIMNATLARNIVGGEACMWGETVDDNNVISRVWPRASAVAERLWSSNSHRRADDTVRARLEEHTCRMIQRGVRAQPPNGPGFCLTGV